MKTRALGLVAALFASPALADPATVQGAENLIQVFQTYFGAGAQAISVVAHGDIYDLTLDLQPMLGHATGAGVTGHVSPIALQLGDNGDGTWAVSLDQPIVIDLSMPQAFDLKETIASMSFKGTFDERLATFIQAKSTFSGLTIAQTIHAPNAPPQTVDMAMDSGILDSTAHASAARGTDFSTTIDVSGLSQTMTTPAMAGEAAMPVTIKAESLTETVTGTQFMWAEMVQLAAWLAAHPDPTTQQAELKAILTAAMPFFGTMQGSGTVHLLSVDTPMGALGVKELGFALTMNGAVTDGNIQEAITLSGLTLPAGLVPAWAEPLVPQAMSLDVQVGDFDAAAAVTTALSALDLPADRTTGPEFDAKLQAALLPKGTVTLTLNPAALRGAAYELTYEGAMVMGPDMDLPTGTATITLTGADALTAVLNAAPDDMKAQAMMGFAMARGMAKAQGDKLVWQIEAATPGALSINGMDLMGGK